MFFRTKLKHTIFPIQYQSIPKRRSLKNLLSLTGHFSAMKVIEHLEKADKTLFSIEILPPLKGKTIHDLFKVLDPLMEFKPPFIDVTYHREEVKYRKNDDGSISEIPLRKRPGTVGICAALMAKYQVDAVPHLVCGGFTKGETEDALFTLHYLGIDNLLLLKGDDIGKTSHIKGGHFNHYACDLVEQVANMNRGHFLHEETAADMSTDFCIGVAGYPEKHFEAPNLDTDMAYLKKKVEMGAEYIVTQMFFDNQKYFDFVDKCRAAGIDVPIIPGLKPLSTDKHLVTLPKMFHIDIPQDLVNEVQKAKDREGIKRVGIEWSIQQSKELIAAGVPCLHFYTMSRSEATMEIARAVF